MERYRKLFLDESRKHLQRVEERLLAPGDLGREGIDEVFREVHSLKGMAGSMGFEVMGDLAHRLEDVLDGWRQGQQAPGGADRDLCVKVCDRLADMRDDVAAGGRGDLPWEDLDDALGARMPGRDDALHVRVELEADCGSPAARAYLIQLRFRDLDPELICDPSEARLLGGAAVETIDLYLRGVDREEVAGVYSSLTEVAGLVFPGESSEVLPEGVPCGDPPPAEVPLSRESPTMAVAGGGDPPPSRVKMPDSVQTPVALLDEFVDVLGELTIARSHIEERTRALDSELLREDVERLGKLVRFLHERVMALRMLPFSLITGSLKRLVREHASGLGKVVDLEISGEEIGLDKSILSEVSDPLVHLLRNALDHGIETPEERRRQGKADRGTIEIRAARARNRVEILLRDDGRGVDVETVRRRAVELGMLREEVSRRLSPAEVFGYLFRPGFSTRATVTELSGRGVGLDVVKSRVEALGGGIELASSPGEGTEIRMRLPLSVAIIPVLLVEVGEDVVAFPTTTVVRTVEAQPRDVRVKDGARVFLTEEGQVPILSLAQALRLDGNELSERVSLVVVHTPRGATALAVDAFLREEDLFIKPLRGPLRSLRGLSGYSVLGDGRLVFLLDPPTLFGSWSVEAADRNTRISLMNS